MPKVKVKICEFLDALRKEGYEVTVLVSEDGRFHQILIEDMRDPVHLTGRKRGQPLGPYNRL